MKLTVRYQAAIIKNNRLLLLKVWDHTFSGKTFWVIPGGGKHSDETEEDCVRREVLEETHLQVEVEGILLDEAAMPEDMYQRTKTYTCRIIGGQARPGLEPEVDTAEKATIQDIGWFDLGNPASWDPEVLNNPITFSILGRVRNALGYGAGETT